MSNDPKMDELEAQEERRLARSRAAAAEVIRRGREIKIQADLDMQLEVAKLDEARRLRGG